MLHIILTLAWLSGGHGRRLPIRTKDLHSRLLDGCHKLARFKDVVSNSHAFEQSHELGSGRRESATSKYNPLKALAMVSLAFNPEAAFRLVGGGMLFPEAASRVGPQLSRQLRRPGSYRKRNERVHMMDLTTIVTPYLDSLHEHYFATTAIQAFTLVGTGDFCAQMIELGASDGHDSAAENPGAHVDSHTEAYAPMRTLRMALLGSCIAGFGTAAWLQFLENLLPAGSGSLAAADGTLPHWACMPFIQYMEAEGADRATMLEANLVVVKASLDALIWAPIANGAYLMLTPLSEGKSMETAGSIFKQRIAPVMKTELATFFPYNLVSFSLVAPLVRPFTTGFVSMCFAVYISWITHLKPTKKAA